MLRCRRFRLWLWLAVLLAVIGIGVPRSAQADTSTAAHGVQVAVLSLDSDDAEDQADALTGALKSRILASQGWSLVGTTQSLGMLTAALRCPGKPIPADCEQRIGEQIKSERYIFGYLTKGPQAGQVTAEIHLYQKSKPDTVIRESYADNLKDQNDDTLKKIAQRVLDRLGGNAVGVIVVRMGSENGEVVVDGDKRVPLQNGTARLELSPGSHSVEVAVTGQSPQKRNVLVTAGKETLVDLAVAPTGPAAPDKPFPTRKVVGGVLGVAGLVALTFGVVNLVAYIKDQDDAEDIQKRALEKPDNQNPPLQADQGPRDVCGGKDPRFGQNFEVCKNLDEADRHSTIAWITLSGGALLVGAGAYFLFTDGGSSDEKTAKTKPKTRIVPNVGFNSGGLTVVGTF